MRRFFSVLVVLIFASAVLATPHATQAQGAGLCFNVPGITDCIEGRFRQYWEQNGGLAVFGYPISAATNEVNRDTGQTYLTQWFQRNRFELHPENQRPYDVLLGRLGDDGLRKQGRDWQTFPKAEPSAAHFFPQSGHAIAHAPFWAYWSTHGLEFEGNAGKSQAESLALFGLPISEPAMETNSSGDNVLTQWFERARFEDHGAKGVLLGLLGNEIYAKPGPGTVLYQADWSSGMNGWAGSPSWKTVSGMLVNDGSNCCNPGEGSIAAPYRPGSLADYAVEAEIQWVKGESGADAFGVMMRAEEKQSYTQGYWVGYSGNFSSSSEAAIWAGPFLSGHQLVKAGFDFGTDWHTYRAEVQGNTIRFRLDGMLILETTDNRFLSGGRLGLWSAGVQINVRSFKVIKL